MNNMLQHECQIFISSPSCRLALQVIPFKIEPIPSGFEPYLPAPRPQSLSTWYNMNEANSCTKRKRL
jgi:hypothetical protein